MDAGGETTMDKTRIYVGGLGGGVTEEDLRKTFSALGEVVAVDVVRTKGRSFAYLDFIPSSDKSLPKLFSTYNGCTWKGGKLRLEKAKEHYLSRMRREWQEDAERTRKASSNKGDSSESHDTLERPKKPSSDKMQFHIYFPKLRKVKSLASVGIGKHKYSFQRIQVPSTPNHFCDCEEHSCLFLTSQKKNPSEVENAYGGINDQELDIMNSVMNRILGRENQTKQTAEKSELVNERGVSGNSDDELLAADENEEDHLTDEDNLIINVGSGKIDNMDLLEEMKTSMANQGPVSNSLRTSSAKRPKNMNLSKKRKSLHPEKNDSNNTMIPETERNPRIHSNAQRGSTKKLGTKQSVSRPQKSTWKDLINQKESTPFSISDIISTVPQEKEIEAKGDDLDLDLPQRKNTHNTPKKKRKTDGTVNKTVVSCPETSEFDPHAPCEEEDELRADNLQMPLTSDVLPSSSQLKEEKPKGVDEHGNAANSMDLEAPPSKHKEDLIRTARGEAWRHKSSWTQLISNTGNIPFSISQVVPDLSSEKHQPRQGIADNVVETQPANKNLDTAVPEPFNSDEKRPEKEVRNSTSPVKNTSERKRILSIGNLDSKDTCPFMRTEASMKEWRKTKAALANKKKRSVKESVLEH